MVRKTSKYKPKWNVQVFRYGIDPEPDWFVSAKSMGNVSVVEEINTVKRRTVVQIGLTKVVVCEGDYLVCNPFYNISVYSPDVFPLMFAPVYED